MMGRYTFGPEIPRLSCPSCGRQEHGSTACNPIVPLIITVDEHPCEAYRQGIRTVIKGLLDGDDLDAVMNALTDLLAYD